MARFTYTAQREGGDVYRGSADALDRFELYKIIRREGGKVISVSEEGRSAWWDIHHWNARITSVPEQLKISFAQSLSAMLKAGLALSRALSVIERQTRNPRFGNVLSQVASDVRRGTSLHEALEKFPNVFSALFSSMVKSGEESGNLSGSLKTVADQMERMHSLKKKVRGALMYPAIIVVAIFGIGTLMMIQVVPTLAQTFQELNVELPASTMAVIGVSNFLVGHTLIAGVMFVIIFVLLWTALRTEVGKRARDRIFLSLPLIGGIVREVNSARTARTLSSLLASGVPMLTTIGITRDVVQNRYFKDVLKAAEESVQRGEVLSKSFLLREDLYPPLVGEMISVGEETGDLAGMLENLANFYEEEVSRKTKDMSTIIEPFLMVIIGGAVGFFAISMISPIYKLSDAI